MFQLVIMTFVSQNGESPLYTASSKGHLQVVKTLMEAGANANQANKVGIHYIVSAILINIWDHFREQGPNTCFFKISIY